MTFIGIIGLAVYPIGIGGNLFNLLVFSSRKFSPTVTTALFRSQCVFDILVILIILITDVDHFYPNLFENCQGRIHCHLWQSAAAFWFTVVLSELNLVGISMDRMFAVTRPVWYRNCRNRYCFCFFVIAIAYSTVVVIPKALNVTYNGVACEPVRLNQSSGLYIFFRIYTYLWTIFSYVLPFSIIIFSHVAVIVVLRRSRCQQFHQQSQIHHQIQQQQQQQKLASLPSSTQDMSSLGERPNRLSRTLCSLYKTTSLMALLFLLTRTMAVVRYYLNLSGVPGSEADSVLHRVSIRLITVGSCFNPVLLFFTVPLIRDTVADRMWCCRAQPV